MTSKNVQTIRAIIAAIKEFGKEHGCTTYQSRSQDGSFMVLFVGEDNNNFLSVKFTHQTKIGHEISHVRTRNTVLAILEATWLNSVTKERNERLIQDLIGRRLFLANGVQPTQKRH